MAFSRYCRVAQTHFLNFEHVMQGKIDFNAALDNVIEAGSDEKESYGTAEMLMTIYFPPYHQVFDKLIECRGLLNDILEDYKTAYRQGHFDGERHLKPYQSQLCRIEDIDDEMKAAIRLEAERLH